eukprot:1194625-Prorocentrum_minimum.AAC.6
MEVLTASIVAVREKITNGLRKSVLSKTMALMVVLGSAYFRMVNNDCSHCVGPTKHFYVKTPHSIIAKTIGSSGPFNAPFHQAPPRYLSRKFLKLWHISGSGRGGGLDEMALNGPELPTRTVIGQQRPLPLCGTNEALLCQDS